MICQKKGHIVKVRSGIHTCIYAHLGRHELMVQKQHLDICVYEYLLMSYEIKSLLIRAYYCYVSQALSL